MVERVVKPAGQGELFLPPGFRFHPTDEEVITSYLLQKFLNPSFAPRAIGEVNLNKCEPWDLPSRAKMGVKEWYFFCHKDMKYPTGMRTNRATKEGYWKATGKDREIFNKPAAPAGPGGRELVGMKKTLVFYMGRAPRGSKTNWVMHEFRLEGMNRDNANQRLSPKDEWVVCKVFHKNNGEDKKAAVESSVGTPNVSSISVDVTGDGNDFLDTTMTDSSMYFSSTVTLPSTTTMNAAPAVAPHNAVSCTAAAATTTCSTVGVGTFVDLPNFTFSDRNPHQATLADSWNLLHAGHPMSSYNLYDQTMMANALGLGGVVSPNFAAGDLPSSSVTGEISQRNYSPRRNYYVGSYATNYVSSDAKNLGA